MTSLVLIKNLNSEHLEMFRANGRVLLSSLKRLREKEGEGRDELEGVKSIELKPTQSRTYTSKEISQFYPPNISIQGGFFRYEAGSKINFGTRLPEAYVFCTSAYRLHRFGPSNYRILDVQRFGQVLFDSLRVRDPQVFGHAFGRITYGGMKDPIDDLQFAFQQNYSLKDLKLNDYYCKPICFASEGEYRYVFFTENDLIQDKMCIECMSLVTLCAF
jgi:hypothetical protein